MQRNTALISMSPDTLQGLRNSGYTLEMFRVVNTNDDGAMPTVCFSFKEFLEHTALTWTDQAIDDRDQCGRRDHGGLLNSDRARPDPDH
jgi:hypothetical protein